MIVRIRYIFGLPKHYLHAISFHTEDKTANYASALSTSATGVNIFFYSILVFN